jgi:eukaryotic-like serine/threonine-protein kinase
VPEYLLSKADLLESQRRLVAAATVYRAALKLNPDDARAKANAELCEQLAAIPAGADGKPTRESLSRLYKQMIKDQRPAAELMPVARALGDEKKYIVEYWLGRLKGLPVTADNPLEKRLSVREDGLLELNLDGTEISDLSLLAGMPLGTLNIGTCKNVTDLSPLRGLQLTELTLENTGVTSLEPLRGMSSLQKLIIDGTKVSDLSPLVELRLNELSISGCPVTSLAPLHGMPLEKLVIRSTGVINLSPLTGMPLKKLDATGVPVTDFSPLTGLPIEICFLQGERVGDLAFLKGAPLKQLTLLGSVGVRNLAILSEIRTLEVLGLPNLSDLSVQEFSAVEALRNHPSIKQLAAEIPINLKLQNFPSKDEFWKNWERDHAWALRLRRAGFTFNREWLADGTWSVAVSNQTFSDLSLLEGAAISSLDLGNTKISDLSPLKSMPLTWLDVSNTSVEDLAPLRGMKLVWISLFRNGVRDLSPLSGMPLKYIELRFCDQVTDFTPLGQIPSLETVHLPIHATNLEPLRKLPNLKDISFNSVECTPAEFWKTWDGLPWARTMEAAGISFDFGLMTGGFYNVTVHDPTFTDCSIFKGSNVRRLDLDRSGVTDLTPLTNLPLQGLSVGGTKVTDLSPLRSPTLTDSMHEVRLGKTKVADFSPVAGCKNLEVFDASDTALPDLSLVKGMKLSTLIVARTAVADISVVTGMPLETVDLAGTKVTDLSPLLKCPTLRSLLLPEDPQDVQSLHTLPNLARISYTAVSGGDPNMTADQFWASIKGAQSDSWIAALRTPTITPKTRRLKDGSWELILDDQPIADLSMLKGAQITRLSIAHSRVTDLSPLRGMKLTFLRITGTQVSDLSPVQGMPITNLTMTGSNVSNLAPLVGMPLRALNMADCTQITDLSLLADNKTLDTITLPPGAKNIDFLRKLPKLKQIGYKSNGSTLKTADEFWAEFDRQKAAAATQPGEAPAATDPDQ